MKVERRKGRISELLLVIIVVVETTTAAAATTTTAASLFDEDVGGGYLFGGAKLSELRFDALSETSPQSKLRKFLIFNLPQYF